MINCSRPGIVAGSFDNIISETQSSIYLNKQQNAMLFFSYFFNKIFVRLRQLIYADATSSLLLSSRSFVHLAAIRNAAPISKQTPPQICEPI